METVTQRAGRVGQHHVHETHGPADHADLREIEADGFLQEDIEYAERSGYGPECRAEEEIPEVGLAVALDHVDLHLRYEARAAPFGFRRRGIFPLLHLPAHEPHADGINKRRTHINFRHVGLGVFENEKSKKHRLEAGDDAEESHETPEEIVRDDIVEQIPEDRVHKHVEEFERHHENTDAGDGDS